ncbi:MAG: toxin-antitoxin system HicB family antitoxin [Acidobacteria bacterium]|nr:toxin-antitoxin system HicB family antitoxin [Acidobacteriota bacterium]
MSSMNIELPDSLLKQAREMAEKDGVPLEQFIASALAEKMAAWRTVEYLKERASHGDHAKFQAAMSRVADVEPDESDRIL